MKIEGSVALVTGGAAGIGRALVETLLKKGTKLVSIVDIDEVAGSATEKEFQKTYGKDMVKFFTCDVASKEQLQDAFRKVQQIHNRLDIVFNNAGIGDEDHPERVIQINLLGVMNGTFIAKDIMTSQSTDGVIVNTASILGLFPGVRIPSYAAAKSGVVNFTRSLAQNPQCLAANIRLNAICPGYVDTALCANVAIDINEYFVPMSEVMKAFLMAVENDSLNGQAIRITPGCGVDLHPFEPQDVVDKLNFIPPL